MTDATPNARRPVQRPISPHLQIYRPHLTMVMSILHRITGSALYLGTLLVAWLLVAAAAGPGAYATASGFLTSWFGKLILFGYTWALMHHMLGGVRHLIWDTGRGLGVEEREWLAKGTIIGSLTLTFAIWLAAFAFGGR